MDIHQLSARVRRHLPMRLFSALRTAGNVVLTPALFSYYSGHARSALLGRAVDRSGAPIPWYTYPANHFFAAQSYRGKKLLEFGAGHSTLWWAERVDQVVSFEAHPGWYEELKGRVPANVELHLAVDKPTLERDLGQRRFDLVVIDGPDNPELTRAVCAYLAPTYVTDTGAIVLDNSEGSWSPDGRFVIMEFFRKQGWQRVDFYGWGPANIAPACTSIFFRDRCFLFTGQHNPQMPYPLSQHE